MLQGGYPAKLKKVLIVTAPLWFKAPFKILRLFVREKLRDRVFTVSIPQVSIDTVLRFIYKRISLSHVLYYGILLLFFETLMCNTLIVRCGVVKKWKLS